MDKEDQKYQDKLRGLMKEILGEATLTMAKEIGESTNEQIAKALEANKELADRVEAMEKAPAQKVALPVPGQDKTVDYMYKGYDLRRQGAKLDLPDEKKEVIAKWLIDVLQGKATNVEGTASRGGYLVPDEYGDAVMAHARLISIALQEAMVIDMNTDTLRIPKEASNVAVTWTAEEASLGASNPTFGEIVLTAQRLGSYTTASNELLADEQYDFVSMLTSQFGEAIGQELDDSLFNGGGGSTFTGALSAATTNTVSCAATGTSPNRHIQITHAELSEAISKLTDNKLMGAKFYVHQNSMHYIRVEEDTAGNPVFAKPGNGVPGTIYEYPYRVNQNVGSATPAAATPFILFGNLAKYYVIGRRRGNMVLEVDPYGLFDTYRTRFRMVTRWDGTVTLEDGLVAIKTHA
jgi:HK97 family phage major capsid protein